MKRFLMLLNLLGLLTAMLPQLAQAQATPAANTPLEYTTGPYKVRVTFDRSPLKSAQDFYMTVERLTGPENWTLAVQGVPALNTSATPVKIEGNFDTSDPAKKLVKMQLPISGNWRIQLTLKSQGIPDQTVGILTRVEPPPVIETWLAWVLGLTPIIGLVGFFLGQWRLVAKRRRAEKLQSSQPEPAGVDDITGQRPPVSSS